MANQSNVATLQVCAMRVAKLDINGDALAGANNGYIASTLIEATIGVDVENGIEILKKDGCDNVAVNFRGDDLIKRSTIDMKLTTLDSELISLLINGTRIINGTTTIGGRIRTLSETPGYGVAVEFWSKAWNVSEQARPAVLGGQSAYWHWVIPKAKFQFDPMDLKDDAGEIAIKGYGYENTSLNIDGPYNDWGTSVATSGGMPSALGWFLDTTIPLSTGTFVTVPAQGS